MAQTPPDAPDAHGQRPDEPASDGERIGDYVLVERLRKDRLGEVFVATGPSGAVRVRVTTSADSSAALEVLAHLRRMRCPAVAAVLDTLADDSGRVAVVTPPDRLTL